MSDPSTSAFIRSARSRRQLRAGLVLAASAMLALTACAAGPAASGNSPTASAPAAAYPLSIANCDRTLTFEQAPQRVVSLAQPQTDLMVELGLADRVVGQAQVVEPDGLAGSVEPSGAEKIPIIAKSDIPAKEVTVSQAPDLVLAPTTLEFDGKQGYATIENLTAAGASAYLAAGGCPASRTSRSVEDPLVDIDSLGRVFGVQDRAGELASTYRASLDEVATALKGVEPTRVAEVYVWGKDVQSLVGSPKNDVIRAAGGENVFAPGDPRFKGLLFANLSAEVVAATEPEAFVFSASSVKEADQVRAILRKTFPSTPAVRNDRLIAYSSVASLPGSLNTPAAVRHVAEQLHPDAFR